MRHTLAHAPGCSRALAAAGAAALLLLAGGCMRTTSGGGLGSYSYRMGELRSEMADSLDRTFHAAVAAADQSQLIIRAQERGDGWARVLAQRGDGTDVKIQLQRVSPAQTDVRVKVGVLGNEPQSRALLDQMRYALATAP